MKALIFCLLIATPSWILAKPVMQVSSINDEAHKIMEQRVQWAYAKLGFATNISKMPALRAIRQAENDQHFDAVMARDASAQALLPHYLQLEIPIQRGQIVAYSKNNHLQVTDWESVHSFHVAGVRGILSVSQPLASHPKLELVNTPYQAMLMLERGRVDLAIMPSDYGQHELDSHNYPQIRAIAVLNEFALYHYLHKRHASLAPALEQALAESVYSLKTDQQPQLLSQEAAY